MASASPSLAELVEAGDHKAIAAAYQKAADEMGAQNNMDAAYFFLTHAYVHALEAGLDQAEALAQRLRDAGRL
ncbi:MAG: hypothetical protein AAFR71_15730 [Pseudomonadota bacterium]